MPRLAHGAAAAFVLALGACSFQAVGIGPDEAADGGPRPDSPAGPDGPTRDALPAPDAPPDACVPAPGGEICNGLDDDCDLVPDNGIDLLGSVEHCGSCTVRCTNAWGTTACAGGTCAPACAGAYARDCDGNPANGCEARDTDPSCSATAIALGVVSGDQPSASVSDTGFAEAWYRVRVREDSGIDESLTATVDLQSPPGVDFDLYVYCLACGGTLAGWSMAGAGQLDAVGAGRYDTFGDASFDILIEIRRYDASACGTWTLTVRGDTSTGDRSCP